MSKIALSSNASGTGVFTIASPNSNTDRTLTLPDNTGTLVTNVSGSVSQAMLAAGVAGNGPLLVSGGSTAISVSANTSTAFTSFAASAIDTASCFNTANGRFTPTVAGYYHVIASVNYGSNGVTTVAVNASVFKNGAATSIYPSAVYSSGAYPTIQTSALVYLNGSTDYVQVYTYIVGNSATSVYAQLQAFLARSAT
jgi:hypothetical protein